MTEFCTLKHSHNVQLPTGTAGRYNDGLESFAAELAAAAAKPASRDAHQSVWTEFWNHSDITVKPAISPTDPATAAQADRVTFLDKVNRAAFHSMALGESLCFLSGSCTINQRHSSKDGSQMLRPGPCVHDCRQACHQIQRVRHLFSLPAPSGRLQGLGTVSMVSEY